MRQGHLTKLLFVFFFFWSFSFCQNVTNTYGKSLVASPSAATSQRLLLERDNNFLYITGAVSTNSEPSDIFISKIDKASGALSAFQMYGNTSTGQEIQT